jgi:hypothetical protein
MNVLPSLPLTLSQAIARQEGFYVQPGEASYPTRAQRNNNPGNLEYSAFTRAHGATGTDGRFAIFSSSDAGFLCLIELLALAAYQSLSIEDAIARYAPANENDTEAYVNNVCDWCEVPSTTLVSKVNL